MESQGNKMKKRNLMTVVAFTFLPHIASAEITEKWLCSDVGDNSIYQVIIDENSLTYLYQDEFYNKSLNNVYEIQAIDKNLTIYAVQQIRATPSAEKGSCPTACFLGETITFDRKEKVIHKYSINIGHGNNELIDDSWYSVHKCTNKF